MNGLTLRAPLALIAAVVLLALMNSQPATGQATPQFYEYQTGYYSGPVQLPDLSSHPDAWTYRAQLNAAVQGGVNFAGEYVLTYWGCGTTCLLGAVINARTGAVQFLPGTVCCGEYPGLNTIDFQADSTLIVLRGLIGEQDPMAEHYYQLSGGQFWHLMSWTGNAPGFGGGNQPQFAEKALVCYYDYNGYQYDADACTVGMSLSDHTATDLGAQCTGPSQAYCDIGASGSCSPNSAQYSLFSVHDRNTTVSCPPQFQSAGGPAPRCDEVCDTEYYACADEVSRLPYADETYYQQCSYNLESCAAGCAIDRGECFTYSDGGGTICP